MSATRVAALFALLCAAVLLAALPTVVRADCDCCESERGTCVDFQTDSDHCGQCDSPCNPLQVCCGGACRDSGSAALCDGECNDFQSDESNCGSCGNPCSASETCCSGVCVDTDTSDSHCGGCGDACDSDLTCCSGVCVDTDTDLENCGGCDSPASGCCVGGVSSSVGANSCDECGGAEGTEECCSGSACGSNECCVDGACVTLSNADDFCGNSCDAVVNCTAEYGGDSDCCAGTCRSASDGLSDGYGSIDQCGGCDDSAAPGEGVFACDAGFLCCVDGDGFNCTESTADDQCIHDCEDLSSINCTALGQTCFANADTHQGFCFDAGEQCDGTAPSFVCGLCGSGSSIGTQCASDEACLQTESGSSFECVPSSCSGCDNSAECCDGACLADGELCCDGTPTTTECCDSSDCGADEACCDDTCVDITTDSNCGGCGVDCTGDNQCCVDGGSSHECIDTCLDFDDQNCGACGEVCPGNATCCTVSGETNCFTADQLNTNENCGSCGNACDEGIGETCCDGECTVLASDPDRCGTTCDAGPCPDGQCCVNAACSSDFNLQDDEQNCGDCGVVCLANELCCSGVCTDVEESDNNCGACGNTCPSGFTCQSGACAEQDSCEQLSESGGQFTIVSVPCPDGDCSLCTTGPCGSAATAASSCSSQGWTITPVEGSWSGSDLGCDAPDTLLWFLSPTEAADPTSLVSAIRVQLLCGSGNGPYDEVAVPAGNSFQADFGGTKRATISVQRLRWFNGASYVDACTGCTSCVDGQTCHTGDLAYVTEEVEVTTGDPGTAPAPSTEPTPGTAPGAAPSTTGSQSPSSADPQNPDQQMAPVVPPPEPIPLPPAASDAHSFQASSAIVLLLVAIVLALF